MLVVPAVLVDWRCREASGGGGCYTRDAGWHNGNQCGGARWFPWFPKQLCTLVVFAVSPTGGLPRARGVPSHGCGRDSDSDVGPPCPQDAGK